MAPSADGVQQPCVLHGLSRWYMDTRWLTATSPSLPLLSTLRPQDQETVKAYYHLADRHMSLASYLLKYLFIHRACRVPWDNIVISRTPAPHKRPCYIPLVSEDRDESTAPVPNIEFNVSHQASLIALAGCVIPGDFIIEAPPATASTPAKPSPTTAPATPQVGIDITCTDERSRRGQNSIPATEAEMHSFIDIYDQVFSSRELDTMKSLPLCPPRTVPLSLGESIQYRLRRFYAYWALKEAYIKMTGEALLAPWLQELEFLNVNPPEPAMDGERPVWGPPETGVQVWLYGRQVEDVRIEMVAFGREYLVATATRGGSGFGASSVELAPWGDFRLVDIERDVTPCATGQCQCLR
ncbi:conserved hypothetical protein [Uncinocarpus reesii 1704]|uniref:holo-[acyl-carrier-protein] synthase n=1 Tax=Uncinocarpus reesii (strain UAMH 1704) TaxID=336963 RepID=C4JEF7_UNCRE|nr:uncharacterized protein UREG_00796 [Uncinocarpus reesii 1704]EEP75949.1 conserved hypothetical protein [Uncinocarpus reesii 1704]